MASNPIAGEAHWIGVMQFESGRIKYKGVVIVDGSDELLFSVGDDITFVALTASGTAVKKKGRITNLFQTTEKMATVREWLDVDPSAPGVAILDPCDSVDISVSTFASRLHVAQRSVAGETAIPCAACLLGNAKEPTVLSPYPSEDIRFHANNIGNCTVSKVTVRDWVNGFVAQVDEVILEVLHHAMSCPHYTVAAAKQPQRFEQSELAKRLFGAILHDPPPPLAVDTAVRPAKPSPNSGGRKRGRPPHPLDVAQLDSDRHFEVAPQRDRMSAEMISAAASSAAPPPISSVAAQTDKVSSQPQQVSAAAVAAPVKNLLAVVSQSDWTSDVKFLLAVQRGLSNTVVRLQLAVAEMQEPGIHGTSTHQRRIFTHGSLEEELGAEKAALTLALPNDAMEACYYRKAP